MALDPVNALVTWETAEKYLGLKAGDKEFVEDLINAASQRANGISNRKLKARDYPDMLMDGPGTDSLIIPEYPINSVIGLYIDNTRQFGIETEITDYAAYKEKGLIKLYSSIFPEGIQNVKISFNAGFVDDQIPWDLQFAVLETIDWNMKRFKGKGIGIRSINSPDGVNTAMEITIPLNAQRVFEGYRKVA